MDGESRCAAFIQDKYAPPQANTSRRGLRTVLQHLFETSTKENAPVARSANAVVESLVISDATTLEPKIRPSRDPPMFSAGVISPANSLPRLRPFNDSDLLHFTSEPRDRRISGRKVAATHGSLTVETGNSMTASNHQKASDRLRAAPRATRLRSSTLPRQKSSSRHPQKGLLRQRSSQRPSSAEDARRSLTPNANLPLHAETSLTEAARVQHLVSLLAEERIRNTDTARRADACGDTAQLLRVIEIREAAIDSLKAEISKLRQYVRELQRERAAEAKPDGACALAAERDARETELLEVYGRYRESEEEWAEKCWRKDQKIQMLTSLVASLLTGTSSQP